MLDTIDKIAQLALYPFIFFSLYFQVFMLFNFLSSKKRMDDEEAVNVDYFPSVTFLLPGWNESKHISTTIESIQKLNYPKDKIKIFYLDNNSTDNSREIVEKIVVTDNRVRYIFETKQGKHNALNTGLKFVETELVACLDVDSTLHTNAMAIAAQYFKDQEIKALASCMQLRDIRTIWQRAQAVEYMLSVFWRKAYSTIDAIQVMPGPFSVFRSNVFKEIGDYKTAHNAEDFEMTLRLHKNHMKIANAHKAYVYTVGPDTLRGLIKQRVRWIRGFLENTWDYRFMFFKKEYGHFGLFTLPVAIIFVFYVLYASMYTYLKLFEVWYTRFNNFIYTGLRIPKPNFDVFYITTDVFMFQTVFLLTVLAFIFYVSRNITQDKNPIFINFAVYFLLYPFIVPIFVFLAVYKFIFRKENNWVMQDNKM